MHRFFLLILLVTSQTALAGQLSFMSAKALADHDEASLSREKDQELIQSQAPVIQKALSSCLALTTTTNPSGFVVVVELDSSGKVRKTWRNGNSALAVCFEKVAAEATLVSPPHAPFYSSFEMDFNSDGAGSN